MGYPTRHDYPSPRSKNPKKSWDHSGHPGGHMSKVLEQLETSRDVLPDMTTRNKRGKQGENKGGKFG